ncbi:hypothetical protein [Nostoc sp.]|uniref:hypothetical protein n=1 Tax=Nostoc sp. TaxID=1180 RepID=UPI002FF9A624
MQQLETETNWMPKIEALSSIFGFSRLHGRPNMKAIAQILSQKSAFLIGLVTTSFLAKPDSPSDRFKPPVAH